MNIFEKLLVLVMTISFFNMPVAALCQAKATDDHRPDLVSAEDFFPAGHSYEVDFGTYKYRLKFISETEMTYTSLEDQSSESVKIEVTQIRPKVFMVAWTEASGDTVVHLEDFEKRVVYTNIVLKDGTFSRLKGYLTPS